MEMEYDDLKGRLHIKQATGKLATLWSGDTVTGRASCRAGGEISIAHSENDDSIAIAWYGANNALRALLIFTRHQYLFEWGEVPTQKRGNTAFVAEMDAEAESWQGGHRVITRTWVVDPVQAVISVTAESNVMAW